MRPTDPSAPPQPGVAAVVLAAGLSSRMGAFKPLLQFGSAPMVVRVVESLSSVRGISIVAVVTGHESDAVETALAGLGVLHVHNPEYRVGEMLSSVQAGVRAVAGRCDSALIALGDQPLIEPKTVRSLIDAGHETGAAIVSPVYAGRGGHPILIRSQLFDQILGLDTGDTLKTLMRQHVDHITKVDVADRAVVTDIDTPADYEQALRAWRERLSHNRHDLDAVEV